MRAIRSRWASVSLTFLLILKCALTTPTDWQNEFYANGGDLKFLRGGMQLTPMNQGTLLSVTSAMKIDQDAPFLLRAMRSMPYSDMLPAFGGNTVFVLKVKQKAGA